MLLFSAVEKTLGCSVVCLVGSESANVVDSAMESELLVASLAVVLLRVGCAVVVGSASVSVTRHDLSTAEIL